MTASDPRSLRMVIQQLAACPAYRVVVYGDDEKPRHADFGSQQKLLQALRAALPYFDVSTLPLDPLRRDGGSIVFAGGVDMDDRQLGLLGLI